jgi:hypothetical protein
MNDHVQMYSALRGFLRDGFLALATSSAKELFESLRSSEASYGWERLPLTGEEGVDRVLRSLDRHLTGPRRDEPSAAPADSLKAVAISVARLRATLQSLPRPKLEAELDNILERLRKLKDWDDMDDRIHIPFTLTYFREARDIGRQWAQARFDNMREHTSVDSIFDATWVESNARLLLGLRLEDYATSEDYAHVQRWVWALSGAIANAARRHFKKLKEPTR